MNDPKDPLSNPPAKNEFIQELCRVWSPILDRLADKVVQRLSRTNRPAEPEHLLTVAEAVRIIGGDEKKARRWLYNQIRVARGHGRPLPFVRRLSRKNIRFDEAGLRRWLVSRR